MCVYIYTYIYKHTYTCTHAHSHAHTHTHTHTRMHTHTHTHTHTLTGIRYSVSCRLAETTHPLRISGIFFSPTWKGAISHTPTIVCRGLLQKRTMWLGHMWYIVHTRAWKRHTPFMSLVSIYAPHMNEHGSDTLPLCLWYPFFLLFPFFLLLTYTWMNHVTRMKGSYHTNKAMFERVFLKKRPLFAGVFCKRDLCW